MRWSKLKSLIEAKFATHLNNRVAIHSTRYGDCTCGRAWLTLDGKEIANFCTRAHYNKESQEHLPSVESQRKFDKMPVEYGEISRQDVHRACWDFVHELSIEEALKDQDALIQTLAVLDARIGKRRLQQLDTDKMHPLARKLYFVRVEAEGLVLK